MRTILLASAAAFALSQAAAAQESARNSTTSQLFATISEGGNFSSNVVGLDVYSDNKQYIGQIEDIAMNQDGQIQAYILSTGGVMRIGERYVAVNPSAVKISYSRLGQGVARVNESDVRSVKGSAGIQICRPFGGESLH